MVNESPFRPHRYEYAGEKVYFLPQAILEKLERDISTYLVGTRGTGKTTLFKALEWEERLQNPWLRDQLNENAFSAQYIGVYLKLPAEQVDVMERWLSETNDDIYVRAFVLYLDLVWMQLAFEAVAELTVEGILPGAPTTEREVVGRIWDYLQGYEVFERSGQVDQPTTFLSVRDRVRRAREGLFRAALEDQDIDETLRNYPVGAIGGLGRRIGRFLASYCDECSREDDPRWHFRVCMDEGECLSKPQLRAVNSAVRLTEWPVFWLLSLVGPPEGVSATFIPGMQLTDDDRQLVVRDDVSDEEFKELVEGVGAARFSHTLGTDFSWTLESVLGSSDVDQILARLLDDESVSPNAKSLLEKAEGRRRTGGEEGDKLPITEVYLDERTSAERTDWEEPWKERRQDSAVYRKKKVAAYLSLCHELGFSVRYLGTDMILQMSDGCIRDFLRQMHEIFIQAGRTTERFADSAVSGETQNRALRRASEGKLRSIENYVTISPKQADSLVHGLGELTAQLQSRDPYDAHLRSTERGVFLVEAGTVPEEIPRAIREASGAGYLRVMEDDRHLSFRVHTSLAPKFGFSYRGAYYGVNLRGTEAQHLFEAEGPEQRKRVVRTIYERVTGEPEENLTLF